MSMVLFSCLYLLRLDLVARSHALRATNRARELQIELAECQVEHANAVMTLMGHRIHRIQEAPPKY